MREILFRAKRVDNGEWVEGYYTKLKWCNNIIHVVIPEGAEIDSGNTLYEVYEINPETICQYTGMVDKNGNRIWENDIVSAWSEGKYATGMVKQRIDGLYIIYPAYQHNEFWGLCPDKNRKTNVEVIGNVFDDKYLLSETDYCREQEQETEDSHDGE